MVSSTSVNTYGAYYWARTAHFMSTRLRQVVENRSIEAGTFPEEILDSAREFFNRARAGSDANAAPALPSSLDVRTIATGIFIRVADLTEDERLDYRVEQLLTEYSAFLDALIDEGPMTVDKIDDAEALIRFFDGLIEAGELESYWNVMGIGHPSDEFITAANGG